jgi:hypothetical protein
MFLYDKVTLYPLWYAFKSDTTHTAFLGFHQRGLIEHIWLKQSQGQLNVYLCLQVPCWYGSTSSSMRAGTVEFLLEQRLYLRPGTVGFNTSVQGFPTASEENQFKVKHC